jgi:L-rhamnonate dehydratase
MSVHDQYSGPRSSWGKEILGQMIVEVVADDGTTGVGIANGGEPACFIVEKHLARFIEGQDPRNIELMWDQMFRATINYGRKGLPIQAISAVDLALWDLLGKIRDEPVYGLLGGKTKDRVPCYCTTARPDLAQGLGFVGAKYPLAYVPAQLSLFACESPSNHIIHLLAGNHIIHLLAGTGTAPPMGTKGYGRTSRSTASGVTLSGLISP